MPSSKRKKLNAKFHPVTKSRWKDFEKLFGERGACGGCWCMWWRLSKKEYEKKKGIGNKRAMKKHIDVGNVPGIIAYVENEPAGWCAVAPREEFIRLKSSRILKPTDEKPVWSLMCLFIDKKYRKMGFSVDLLKAACNYAAKRGAKTVEGYPTEVKNKLPDAFAYTGLPSSYKRAGFKEVLRRSKSRPIMRYEIKNKRLAKKWL